MKSSNLYRKHDCTMLLEKKVMDLMISENSLPNDLRLQLAEYFASSFVKRKP